MRFRYTVDYDDGDRESGLVAGWVRPEGSSTGSRGRHGGERRGLAVALRGDAATDGDSSDEGDGQEAKSRKDGRAGGARGGAKGSVSGRREGRAVAMYPVGGRVEAALKGSGGRRWANARITAVHGDGSVDLRFDPSPLTSATSQGASRKPPRVRTRVDPTEEVRPRPGGGGSAACVVS